MYVKFSMCIVIYGWQCNYMYVIIILANIHYAKNIAIYSISILADF